MSNETRDLGCVIIYVTRFMFPTGNTRLSAPTVLRYCSPGTGTATCFHRVIYCTQLASAHFYQIDFSSADGSLEIILYLCMYSFVIVIASVESKMEDD